MIDTASTHAHPFPESADMQHMLRNATKPASRDRAHLLSQHQRKPTEHLMDNSNDRPDVATIAILGYN